MELPIKNYEVNGIDEGVAFSQKMMDSQEWIYLKIHTDTFIPNHLLKEIRKNKNILEIIPVTKNGEVTLDSVVDYGDLDIKNAFVEFYKSFDEGEPQEETINLFMKFLGDDESATLDSVVDYGDLDIKNAFVEFYKSFDEGEPQEETINLFMKFLGDDESATD